MHIFAFICTISGIYPKKPINSAGSGALTGIIAQTDVARAAPIYEIAELVKDISMNSDEVTVCYADIFSMT